MKKMHKIGAGILTVSLLVTAMALPAMAENGQSTDSAATVAAMVTARGGRQGGQMPGNGNNRQGQMPGNGNNQQGQVPGNGGNNQNTMPGIPGNSNKNQNTMPGMPGNGNKNQNTMPGNPPAMNGQQQQAPQKPETAQQDTQTTPDTQTTEEGATQETQETQQQTPQTPAGKGRRGGFQKNGRMGPMNGRGAGHVNFKELVEKGIIGEETLTKIEEYLKKNAPAKPQMPADGQTAPDGQTPPEKPEGDQAATDTQTQATPVKPEGDSAPTQGELPEEDNLIAKLVEAGILTQEQAETIESLTKTTAETNTAASENT